MNRRHCIAGIAAVTPAPACLVARAAATNERRWPALQITLDEFVGQRHAAGVSVAITSGDSPPAYPSAGTLAFDTATPFDRDREATVCSDRDGPRQREVSSRFAKAWSERRLSRINARIYLVRMCENVQTGRVEAEYAARIVC